MKPKVYITTPIPEEVEQYIAKHCDHRKWNGAAPITREELFRQLSDVDGLLTVGGKIDAEMLQHAPLLKVVSNIAVGYNNFDLEAMKARGVMGTNTPHVLDETVADLVFGLILSAARRLPELDRLVKTGAWSKGQNEVLFGVDVHSTTLGIIGLGRIGEAVARRAKFGFNMEVLYYNRHHNMEAETTLGVKYSEFHALLESSDYILLMTPLTPQTEKMIGRTEFAMMKKSAIFINASRGKTVDEPALIHALQNGVIRAAGLDVYEQEPVAADNPLLQMDNVITLPHIGSATAKTRFDMAMLAAQNLVDAVSGVKPSCLVKELQ